RVPAPARLSTRSPSWRRRFPRRGSPSGTEERRAPRCSPLRRAPFRARISPARLHRGFARDPPPRAKNKRGPFLAQFRSPRDRRIRSSLPQAPAPGAVVRRVGARPLPEALEVRDADRGRGPGSAREGRVDSGALEILARRETRAAPRASRLRGAVLPSLVEADAPGGEGALSGGPRELAGPPKGSRPRGPTGLPRRRPGRGTDVPQSPPRDHRKAALDLLDARHAGSPLRAFRGEGAPLAWGLPSRTLGDP